MKINSLVEFEKQWQELAQKIGKKIIEHPEIVALKKSLETNGYLTEEERSVFMVLADKIKYDLIYEIYGQHDSEGYGQFKEFWQKWLAENPTLKAKALNKSQESSNHFMYGSTPDPEKFLQEFESQS